MPCVLHKSKTAWPINSSTKASEKSLNSCAATGVGTFPPRGAFSDKLGRKTNKWLLKVVVVVVYY